MQIKDKVVILTGAARVGLDVGRALSAKGAKLVVAYANSEPAVGDLKIKADLTKQDEVSRLVAETKKNFGRIDAVVHMAANYQRTRWPDLNNETWDASMDVIARSAFTLSKAAADEMAEGKIILVSDWSVQTRPYKDYLPYNVAKSAVEGLTLSLAKELAPRIAVNCIAPGPILMPPDLSAEENDEVMKNTPLQKWGGGEEIAKAVVYLLETDFVTGQILKVDGGRSIA